MTTADRQILNLLHRYAEAVDDGDFDAVSALFAHADYGMKGDPRTVMRGDLVGRRMRTLVKTVDGSPRTKHVITNAIVDVDDDAGTATSRSYFTVFQATGSVPLQPIVTGRYHDRFECVDGTWRFAQREIVMEQFGDMSDHLVPGAL